MVIKVHLNSDEHAEMLERAREAQMPISTYIKSQLTFTQQSAFQQVLSELIEKTDEVPAGTEFSIKALYSEIEWKAMLSNINAGQLGKRFYDKVMQGLVDGVSFVGIKNGLAKYRKN